MAFSVAAGRRLDPFPVCCCRACAVNARGVRLARSYNCSASFEISTSFHVPSEARHHLRSRADSAHESRPLRWRSGRERDTETDQPPRGAYSRITAVDGTTTLGSGSFCGAPKQAGSGSHDLPAGELENWNRSALTGGVQTTHGQKRCGAGLAWMLRGLSGG